jgi:hypothetical protein
MQLQHEGFQEVLGRGHREKRTARMVAGIVSEKLGLDESGAIHPKVGLTNAHRKLSDYYGKIDDSPYYTWASCE